MSHLSRRRCSRTRRPFRIGASSSTKRMCFFTWVPSSGGLDGSRIDRQPDQEGCTNARHRFECKAAAMFVHNHCPGNRQALPGASTDLLGAEEWIEDLALDGLGYSASRILHGDHNRSAILPGAHRNRSAAISPADRLLDGVCGVYQDVEKGLVEFADVADDQGDVREPGFYISNVLVFVACDGQRTQDGCIEICRGHGSRVRM